MAENKKKVILTGEYFSLDKITACVILDARRPKSNGLSPIKYRVTYLRKRVYYPSGVDLSITDWEPLQKTRSKELIRLRELIQNGFGKV